MFFLAEPVAANEAVTAPTGDAQHVIKGQPAPFDGFLLSPEKAQKVRMDVLELQYQTKLVTLANSENQVMNDRIDRCQRHSEDLSKELSSEKDSGLLSKVGYFIIGAGVASLVAFGAARAVR